MVQKLTNCTSTWAYHCPEGPLFYVQRNPSIASLNHMISYVSRMTESDRDITGTYIIVTCRDLLLLI